MSLYTPSRMSQPCARAAATQSASQVVNAARPGTNRARVSFARSLRPITSTSRRAIGSAAVAAIEPALENRHRRLHHRPEPGLLRRAGVAERARRQHDPAGTVDLGEQNCIRRGGDRGFQVRLAPRRVSAVHAHDHFAGPEAAFAHCLHDLCPRRDLGVRRDRILEIEDDRVRGQLARLCERLRIGTGHIEHATTRPSDHDNLLTTPQHRLCAAISLGARVLSGPPT